MKPVKKLQLFISVIIILGVLLACGGEEIKFEEPVTGDDIQVIATETPAPVEVVQAQEGAAGTWTIMLYQDADDEILEKDIFIDLNEAEVVGSTDQVTIVTQIDRYDGSYSGDGNWDSTKRFLVGQDGRLEALGSQELVDLGEVDMSDKDSLVEFASWAIQNYPAEKYALILSDHGMGWLGGWSDDDPVPNGEMAMYRIDQALAEIVARNGIGQLEFVGFDACLMAQIETMSAIAPHARYAVASEEVEPALGWAYAGFLKTLTDNPAGLTGADFATAVVDSYITQDFRIVDDAARQAFVSEVFGYEGTTTAQEVIDGLGSDITLSAFDLSKMGALNAAFNNFILAAANTNQTALSAARSYAQPYTSVFGNEVPASFIDLGHFVALAAAQSGDAAVQSAALEVQDALSAVVIAEKHGPNRPGSSGLSIYFPVSGLYKVTATREDLLYSFFISRFAAASLWDDFLAYHYTGTPIDPASADLTVLEPDAPELVEEPAEPDIAEDAVVVSPGAGGITIDHVTTSSDTIDLEGTVTISSTVRGDNISYIYYYVSYYWEDDGSYLTADMGFIDSDATQKVNGVHYPDWGSDGFVEVEFDWEPTLFFISDGIEENDQFAFFEPSSFGETWEQDVYTVYGQYTFAGTNDTREAAINFWGNGDMKDIFAFEDSDGAGAPRQVSPSVGDTFTIWEEWLEYDEQEGSYAFVDYEGGVMTYNGTPFTMVPYYGFPGFYDIGVIAEDFDGNYQEGFIEIEVTE
jgi:hypothetical protein